MQWLFNSSKLQASKVLGLFSFLILELLNPLNLERALAQANFYQGKPIRIVVGNLPGNTHDLFARAYSRSMGKHIPANPAIIVQICRAPLEIRAERIAITA